MKSTKKFNDFFVSFDRLALFDFLPIPDISLILSTMGVDVKYLELKY